MPRLKIAVQLASLGLPVMKALHTAAELGADAVEIDARGEAGPRHISRTGLRQMRKMLEDLNLRVAAVTYRTRRGYHVADDLDQRIEGTKRALRYARDLGAAVVVNRVGAIPREPTGAAWDLLLQSLTEIGLHGQRVGAVLAAIAGGEDGADLARLVQALPAGAMGVTFDPGGFVLHGFSPADAIPALAAHVSHVYARDAVHDLSGRQGTETALGRGSVDFTELLGALEQRGYRGYYAIGRERSDDPVRDAAQAIHYLRGL